MLAAESTRATESAAENPIGAAKREFEALKANTNGAAAQKGELSGFSMPTLRTTEPEALQMPRIGKGTGAAQKKSGNWLIEAMEKKPRQQDQSRAGEGRESRFSTDEVALVPDWEDSGQSKTPTRTKDRLREAELNPLARYMGEWMTAKDFALLQPGLAGAGQGGDLRTDDLASSPAFGAEASQLGSLDASLGLKAVAKQMKGNASRENPYLQPIEVPALPATKTLPPVSPNVAPMPPTAVPILSVPPPRENGAGRAPGPDFPKPGSDEKYFKQLKRF
ncbi:MAG: hypothetical protein ABIR80_06755 [Opitutaceae bacterium]